MHMRKRSTTKSTIYVMQFVKCTSQKVIFRVVFRITDKFSFQEVFLESVARSIHCGAILVRERL